MSVRQRTVLRMDQGAEVIGLRPFFLIRGGGDWLRLYAEEMADKGLKGSIEINKKFKASLHKIGAEIICVVLKVRTMAIGTCESLPMKVSPPSVLTDAHLAHGGMLLLGETYGDGETL